MAWFKAVFRSILIYFLLCYHVSCERQCFENVCKNCPKTALGGPSRQLSCRYSSMQQQLAVFDLTATEDSSASTEDPDYVCLKFQAIGPRYDRDSTDILSGCVLRKNANSICNFLQEWENDRNKEGDCTICEEDFCNGAIVRSQSLPLILIITSIIMIRQSLTAL